MNLCSLSLRDLVRLHNEHVPEGRRVKTFQTKPIAMKRVAAVLAKEPPPRLTRALRTRAPNPSRKARRPRAKEKAPRTKIDSATALETLRKGCEIAELATALGGTERIARTCIDRLRAGGHKITNTGHRRFKLG